jgi:hypothetical protein
MSEISGGGSGGGEAVVDRVVLSVNKDWPSQAAFTTATRANVNVTLGACGLVTLTDAAANFNANIVDHLVYIGAAGNIGNRGIFLVVDRPTTTSFTYYNAHAVTEAGTITYDVALSLKSCPSGWGTFVPINRHAITINSTKDVVIIHAEYVVLHSALCTDGPVVKIDGLQTGHNGRYLWQATAGGGYRHATVIDSMVSELAPGPHVIAPGLYLDYGWYTLIAGPTQLGWPQALPIDHGFGWTLSQVVVIPCE